MEGDAINSVRRNAPAGTEDERASWSRRRFVAQGLAAMAAITPPLAGAVVRPALEKPPVESPPDLGTGTRIGTGTGGGAATGQAKDGGSSSVHTASLLDNRLATSIYINDRGPYRFLVDTGAERTLIAAEVAAQLGLPRGRKVLVEGITRREPGVLVEIRSLRMGSLVCSNLEIPVLPRALLNVDGYLGLDVLDEHRVVLDFKAETISVTRPQGFFSALWQHWNEAVVHTLGSSGRLRATNCLVDGVRAAAFIDTGAEVSVSNPALFEAVRSSAPKRQRVLGPVGLYGVTGGLIIGLATNIDDIRLGELHLTYTPLVVAALEVFDVWGLSKQPALLFGMDCLRRFARVTIDYGRKELRFEVASAGAVQPLEAELSPPLAG